MLLFYTVQNNIFAAVSAACIICCYGRAQLPGWVRLLRLTAAAGLGVTFLVVTLVLVPMSLPFGAAGEIIFDGAQIYHHLLCPLLTIGSLLIFEGTEGMSLREASCAAMPTVAYASGAVVLNLTHMTKGPYPFLQVLEQPWYVSCVWFLLTTGLALVTAMTLTLSGQGARGWTALSLYSNTHRRI